MARVPSDRSISTVLDISRNHSESSDYHSELSTPDVSLASEDCKMTKLFRIRDCLGLLRELFFMSKQTIPMEQRIDLYSKSLHSLRNLFFSSLRKILCLRTVLISSALSLDQSFKFSLLANPENQVTLISMRIMAADIISSCTLVCPYLIRLNILEGPVPQPPIIETSSASGSTLSKSSNGHQIPETGHRTSEKGSQLIEAPWYPELILQSQSILFVIIERVLCDEEAVVIEHLGDTLKILLDPDRLDKVEREKFLSLFYDYHISWLLLPFLSEIRLPDEPLNILETLSDNSAPSTHVRLKPQNPSAVYASRRFICEIISLCIFGHTYRIKTFIIRTNVLIKFMKLLASPSRYYHIYSIKLIKNIISLKDDYYNRYLVKHNIFKPIFELFSTLYHKDNLITSTIIDLLEYISTQRIQILIYYIVGKLKVYYKRCLSPESSGTGLNLAEEKDERITEHVLEPCQSYYTKLFENFENTYHQLQEYDTVKDREDRDREGENVGKNGSKRCATGSRSLLDAESEEAYFDDDDDEVGEYGPQPAESSSPQSQMIKRVGYFQEFGSTFPSTQPSTRTPPTNQTQTKSSLSLISDLYDDFDDDDPPYSSGCSTPRPISVEDQLHFPGSQVELIKENDFDALPPLKPKFGSDDDEDFENVFLRSSQSHKSSTAKSSSPSPNGASHGPSSGISFSMAKKKQRVI